MGDGRSAFFYPLKLAEKRWVRLVLIAKLSNYYLGDGGGFRYFLFSPRILGKWSNLTSICFKWVETIN